jgi:hypothetical protein
MRTGTIQPISEAAGQANLWNQLLSPWINMAWIDLPWFLAETYFYRRILAMTRYFQPGPWLGKDPFDSLKAAEIQAGRTVFEDVFPTSLALEGEAGFQSICINALWGNRGDLSMTDALDPSMEPQTHRIIINQLDQAYQYLINTKPVKIAYFLDNVGKELYFDLALMDYLLHTGQADQITCCLKNQPFYVSDVMPKDLEASLALMTTSNHPEVKNLSQRIKAFIKTDQIVLKAPQFFTLGYMYREMPHTLCNDINRHHLTILKGDVNYRRLMGDRHWPPTTPVEQAAGYFPTAFLSLRTMKSELVVGLTDEILNNIQKEADPDWMVNGKRGLITFLKKNET